MQIRNIGSFQIDTKKIETLGRHLGFGTLWQTHQKRHISEHRETDLGPSTQKIDLAGRHIDEVLYQRHSTDLGQSDRHRKHVVR